MGTTIITKNGSGAPAASDLVAGELAVDLTNKRLYTEDSSANILELGSNPSTIVVAGTSTLTGNVTASNDLSVGGNLTVTGNATISGNLTFGNAATDTVTLSADVSSHILPSADDTFDLGATGSEWRDIYIDGTAYLDAINFNGTAITATAAELNILDGVTSTAAELNILDGVTATAAELNILDGVTSTAAELNILDGVTATAAELNILDGVTSTAAELNILDGVTSTAAELNLLDGSTANTVVNSKAVVYGSSGELAGTLSTAAQTNITSVGTLTSLTVDDITIDGSTISDSGDLTFDVGGDITLDADGGDVLFADGGTTIGFIGNSSSDMVIKSQVQDKDLIFKGNDGGSTIEAMRIDMSAGGNVGIGTTSPSETLHVAGAARISNNGADTYLGYGSNSDNYISTASGGATIFRQLSTERMRIDSSGNVGIGTTSPSDALHVLDSSGNAYASVARGSQSQGEVGLRLRGGTSGNDWYVYQKTSSNNLNFYNTADRVTIDSSGNVGIGSSSPGTKLHVLSGTDNNIAADVSEVRFIGADKAITGEQANLVIQTNDDMAVNKGGSIGLGGRHTTSSTNSSNFAQISGRKENATSANFAGYLAFGTSDSASDITERMRIDSSGNVGIGTTSPDSTLHVHAASAGSVTALSGTNLTVEGNANNYLSLLSPDANLSALVYGSPSSTNNASINSSYNGGSPYLNFNTGGSEAMRIDSSGHVMVGTTDNTVQTNSGTGNGGIVLRSNNYVAVASDGSAALELNRLDSDGEIANFRKDGTTAGTIGVVSGDIVVGTGDTGLRFYDAGRAIQPRNTDGTAANDVIDLGMSANKFKDLYLSGQTLVSGGAVSAPSYSFVGDTNTGISRPTSDVVNVVTGGSERMRVDSSGNVQIGSTSSDGRLKIAAASGNSAAAELTLWGNNAGGFGGTNIAKSKIDSVTDGTAYGSILRMYTNDTSNNYQERMRIDSSGRVGINRTPSISNSKLEVGGADNVSLINVEASGNTGGLGIGSAGLQLFHGSSSKVLISSGGMVINENSADFDFRVESNGNANMLFVDAGSDKVSIGGTAGDTTFSVQGSNNSAGDLYTAVGAGNVPGIVVQNAGTTDNNNAAVFFKNDAAVVASIGARFVDHSTEETELRFSTTNSSGTTRERVTISGDGSVGFGTTDGDVLSDGNASRTYVGIIGSGTRGVLNIGSTASNGADGGSISFVNGANQLGALYNDANSGSQTVGTMFLTSTGAIDVRPSTEAVFNEHSIDSDFRVESNNNANMLFVDGGNDRVGIGTNSPGSVFNLAFTSTNQEEGIKIHNQQNGGYGSSIKFISDNGDGSSSLTAAQIRAIGTNNWANAGNTISRLRFLTINSEVLRNVLELDASSAAVVNEDSVDMDFRVESNDNTHAIFVDAGNNRVGVLNNNPAYAFHVDAEVASSGYFRVDSSSTYAGTALLTLKRNGNDTGDYLQMRDGSNNVFATFDEGGIILNEIGGDTDFRVESDNNSHALFVEAGADAVGILNGSPTSGSSADFQLGFGDRGKMLHNNSGTVANNGTLDLGMNTGGGGYQGILITNNTNKSNAGARTQQVHAVTGRGTDVLFTQLATDNGTSGGASFTLTAPSNGVVRFTNTSGADCAVSMMFFGTTGF